MSKRLVVFLKLYTVIVLMSWSVVWMSGVSGCASPTQVTNVRNFGPSDILIREIDGKTYWCFTPEALQSLIPELQSVEPFAPESGVGSNAVEK